MFKMDIDSPPQPPPITPGARIVQRLAQLGVPEEYVDQQQSGLVAYVKNNKCQMPEIIPAILPTDEEAIQAVSEAEAETTKSTVGPTIEELYAESMFWLRWLMFECDPKVALEHLAEMNVGQRGVCGAVWGKNDIAYRCRTCEHDPTCAICVPCFQNGNHKDHDYSINYTGGGCCDCGDATAWKREGFCSKHKGAEQIQPLPKEFASSIGPVLDSLLSYWKRKMIFPEKICEESHKYDDCVSKLKKVAEEFTSVVVDMLLEFCNFSESLLSFISGRVFSLAGLLDILVKAERSLSSHVVKRLHELLLKLLGEPQFKYEFAKVFLNYYPTVVTDATKECDDNVLKMYPLLSTFSVQIFTVPTLTPRLVKEMNLLAILLDCLGDIFISCSGDDGRLQVTRWGNLYETTLRVVEDIRFVMSHSVVPTYVARDRRDISRTWMKLLAFVQGMSPQKRETGIHIEEENENIHFPFVLVHSIANIHSLLVGGAFSADGNEESEEEGSSKTCQQEVEDQDSFRHAKVGRISQESSISSMTGRNQLDHPLKFAEVKSDNFPVPLSVLWLTYECLRAIENWLGVDNMKESALSIFSTKLCNNPVHNFFTVKRAVPKFRRGRYIRSFNAPSSSTKLSSSSEASVKQCSSPVHNSSNVGVDLDAGLGGSDDGAVEGEYANELEALRVLSLSDWPDIVYDVSSQEISVHIPLHRLLSMLLQRSLRKCYGESALLNRTGATSDDTSSAINQDFFGQVLGGCHPYGFSAFVMEHLLRIRVFCAEVHAGMWRKNGDASILSCEWYRSVRWSEQGLELDLFLLQCCAALAPADLCVQRILERFGLSDFLSMNLERSSEYESILVQEMLTLIIQIVKERRFSGLTTADCLQRELVYKLSLGDATRSQLVKSLPCELSKFDKLQKILDKVAVYSNPSGMNQGMYKLRLEYWKELDLYHPRWSSRDLQIAEERYMRFCHTSALTSQLPGWSKIYHPLSGVARIATCKTVLQIVRAVLYYSIFSDKSTASRAPDGVLLAALHLLSLALDICCVHTGSGDRSCYVGDVIPILGFASEEIYTARHGDQSLLSLLVLLMKIHEKEKVNNFIEASNFNLSSLIQNLIKKFAELESGCTTKLRKLAPELVNQLTGSVSMADASPSGLNLEADKRKAKARERQAAILEKMRAQQSKFLESIDSSPENAADDSEFSKEMCDSDVRRDSIDSPQVICSLCHDGNSKRPVSYLILLQKSKLLSFVDRGPPTWEQGLSSKKNYETTAKGTNRVSSPRGSESSASQLNSETQLLQSIQSAIEDFASDGQPAEFNAFLEYVQAQFPSFKNIPFMLNDNRERTASSVEKVEERMYSLVQEEMGNKLLHKDFVKHGKDISVAGGIQEKSSLTESLLLGKYIASVSKETADNPSASVNSHSCRNRPQPDKSMPLSGYEGFGPSDCDGIYLSSCGHAVHQGCLDRYLSSLKERYSRRIVFEGGHIVDPDQGEFLCPVCRGLANSVLPALPGDFRRFPRPPLFPSVTAADGLSSSARSDVVVDILRISKALSLLQSASDVAGNKEILKSIPLQQFGRQRSNLESVFRVISSLYFPGKEKISKSGSNLLLLWDTLKYSLISTEIAARSRKTSLIPKYSLDALHSELKSSSGFIISLLLNIVQSTRVKNSVSVLLRLRGIQLFAESICCGISSDEFPGQTNRGGKMQHVLENLEPEVRYLDIQLWKQASHPIIAQDAFSSLMWTLFCLPFPFLSCEDSFLCLVHIFYLVAIVQAIITCCRKQQSGINELEFKDGMVLDIYRFVGEYDFASQHFDSNYLENYGGIKEAIRCLSFPYLRRCALLWRLLKSSMSVPFNFGNHVADGSSYVADDMIEHRRNNLEELIEVEKLEQIFKIPSLDVVVNDDISRSLVLRWLHHFSKEHFKIQNQRCALYSSPAVPFRLMLLPNLYQDLLQRYIKQRCPDCGAVQEESVLCLLCGKLCSPNWKPCCRERGCQTHAMACGAGTGVFLLIRRTTILLQRSARQAPWPSPYLDAYGEEDSEMQRGKPLYLNEERYAALTHMVASHGLDRSPRVLRQTTIGSFFML